MMAAERPAGRGSASVVQMVALSQRSIVAAIRQPANWLPGLFFPFLLAAVFSSQFSKAVDLPAFPFPGITFLDFILPAAILQGVSFASINGGSEMALDIENGFMDRLLSSPVSRAAILVGRLAGAMAYAVAMSVVLLVAFFLMGAEIAGGAGAVVVVLIAAVLLALSLGALASALALRTGNQEVVQSVFPLVFVLIFASSAFFPVSLMDGWYGDLAARNPITWIIDPLRRLVVVGFDWSDAAETVGVAAALAAVCVGIAFVELRRLVARL
jgi:ABC-2 type transport system permease protein